MPQGAALGGRVVRFFELDPNKEGPQTGNGKQGKGIGGKGKRKGNGVGSYNSGPRGEIHVAGGSTPQDVFAVKSSATPSRRKLDIDGIARWIYVEVG